MIRLVIFDLDGTLYDYDSCNKTAEDALFVSMSEMFSVDRNRSVELLVSAKHHVKESQEETAASHNRMLYMQDICEQLGQNPCKYALELYNTYWYTMLQNMSLYDYVLPLFRDIRNIGVKIALLTDLTANIQFRKIKRLGIADYIDYIVTSEEAGVEKPDKKIFQRLLSKAECTPEETIMVGDSKRRDIDGAKVLGIRGIYFQGQKDIGETVEKYLRE